MKTAAGSEVGTLIRDWRTRRRLSQMELALDAGISPRHLSFVETGRAQPGRETLLSLAEVLDVPLRDRNLMLLAAGTAPAYAERACCPKIGTTQSSSLAVIEVQRSAKPSMATDGIAIRCHGGGQLDQSIIQTLVIASRW